MSIDLLCGDVMTTEPGGMFHAMLCDPPYHLVAGCMTRQRPDMADYSGGDGNPYCRLQAKAGFMGKAWDGGDIAFRPETWAALGEHLLPGAFGMAFASSRGWHRMACAIEDAGFVIHPSIFLWTYGNGFPKATRIDTQVDKAAGVEREILGYEHPADKFDGSHRRDHQRFQGIMNGGKPGQSVLAPITKAATPLAATWAGHRYGLQAMKPAAEPIIVFQKPYEGRPVDCITETGAGALWIEGGRVGTAGDMNPNDFDDSRRVSPKFSGILNGGAVGEYRASPGAIPNGRWPSNFILGDDAAAEALDRQSGILTSGASRFFYRVSDALDAAEPVRYCAKASRRERDAGLEGMAIRKAFTMSGGVCISDGRTAAHGKGVGHNSHPTVKPLDLLRYLATLLLPPAEYAPRRILVPFAGVASECIGASLAGWDEVVGIEAEAEYVEIGRARIAHWCAQPALMNVAT